MNKLSPIKSVFSGFALDAKDKAGIDYLAKNREALESVGVNVDSLVNKYAGKSSFAMDSGLVEPVTPGANGVPVQFLQAFLPGMIHIMQKKRSADLLAPIVTIGDFGDMEVIITTLEHLGTPQLYSDHGEVPLAEWNTTYERRSVIRHELGALVTILEDEISSKTGVNNATTKRAAVMLAFEILRNDIFFYGFDSGANRVYGFLNDPNLPAYVTVPNGAGGNSTWESKTVKERQSDILSGLAALRSQSGSNVDVENDQLIMAIASDVKDLMSESDEGNGNLFTVNKWLAENYPNINVIPCEELNGADGGDNVFYLYPASVAESGDDDQITIIQMVPERLKSLNTVTEMKGVKEGYANALAGCMVKRGYAVYRATGI